MREHFLITLTSLAGKDKEPVSTHVNLDHIVAMTALESGTAISLVNGNTITVKETVENINKRASVYGLMRIL